MPAVAVIHKGQAFIGFIGRKASVGGLNLFFKNIKIKFFFKKKSIKLEFKLRKI